MSDGRHNPVVFTRRPLKLRAMQWTGDNEQDIQRELAGLSFQSKGIACDKPGCTCGSWEHPEITAEVRNDFAGCTQGMETGWWVCVDEHGRMFPVDNDTLMANYDA